MLLNIDPIFVHTEDSDNLLCDVYTKSSPFMCGYDSDMLYYWLSMFLLALGNSRTTNYKSRMTPASVKYILMYSIPTGCGYVTNEGAQVLGTFSIISWF